MSTRKRPPIRLSKRRRPAPAAGPAAAGHASKVKVAGHPRTAEALAESEERFRRLVEMAPDAIAVHREGNWVYMNPRGLTLLGAAHAGELLGRPVLDFVHLDDRAAARERIRHAAEGEHPTPPGATRMVRLDGHVVHVEATGTCALYQGELAVLVILRDITDRVRAEEALRRAHEEMEGRVRERTAALAAAIHTLRAEVAERQRAEQALLASEERVRLLLESTAEAIFGLDLQGRCTFCNPACLRLLGYDDPRLLLGRKTHPLIHHTRPDGTPYPPEACRMYEVFRRGEGTHVDDEVLWRADGTSFPAEYWSYPVRRGGEVIGSVVTFLDITERKRAEEALRSSREQLRDLAFHLEAIREAERTRIAREIHDELGQALTGLKLDLSRLAARLPKDQTAVREQAGLLVGLVDANIRWVQQIATELRPGVLDDLGLVAALEWQAQEFQTRTGIACRVSAGVDDRSVNPELATALFRICQEALTNVMRHAHATRIEIRLHQEAGSLVLAVSDNGKGIADGEIAAKKSLGLLGIRERATLLGGEATIVGRAGQGTSVTVRLPLAEPLEGQPREGGPWESARVGGS